MEGADGNSHCPMEQALALGVLHSCIKICYAASHASRQGEIIADANGYATSRGVFGREWMTLGPKLWQTRGSGMQLAHWAS